MSNQNVTAESMEVSKVKTFLQLTLEPTEISIALSKVARRTYLARLLEDDCTFPELEDEEFDQFINEIKFVLVSSTEESLIYSFELFDEAFTAKLF